LVCSVRADDSDPWKNMMSEVDDRCAFILAGGQGSRLQPYTTVLPKPLMPIGDVPISEVVIHQLRDAGFCRIVMAVNHHEALLRSYFGDGSAFGVRIIYSRESSPLGTFGPVRLASDLLPENFLVMNGDLLTDLDYRAFLAGHVDSGAPLTVGVYRRVHRVADGVLEVGADGRVLSFQEKPELSFWISMGIYALNRSAFDLFPPNQPVGMDVLVTTMLGRGLTVRTHRHDSHWYDIGSPEDLSRASSVFAEQRDAFVPAMAGRSDGGGTRLDLVSAAVR
jgi:NDP-mannose synthase